MIPTVTISLDEYNKLTKENENLKAQLEKATLAFAEQLNNLFQTSENYSRYELYANKYDFHLKESNLIDSDFFIIKGIK